MLSLLLLRSRPTDYHLILASPKLDGTIVSAIVTDLDGKVIYEYNSGLQNYCTKWDSEATKTTVANPQHRINSAVLRTFALNRANEKQRSIAMVCK